MRHVVFFCTRDQYFVIHVGAHIRPVVSHMLAVTATKKITVHAIGAYNQPLVSLILAKSYGNRTVARELGELLWQMSAVAIFLLIVLFLFHYIGPAMHGAAITRQKKWRMSLLLKK